MASLNQITQEFISARPSRSPAAIFSSCSVLKAELSLVIPGSLCFFNDVTGLSSQCMPPKSLHLCPTLCDPIDCILPGSSVHGILQARILEWVAMPSSKGSSQPRDWTRVSYVSCIAGGFFTTSATQEALSSQGGHLSGHRAAPHPEASEYKGISAVPGSQEESIPRQLRPGGGEHTHLGCQGHSRCYHKGRKSYHRTKSILPKGNHNS